jgi:murein DD-endopeptidase MepM/ murein hydrolase activator NlpD
MILFLPYEVAGLLISLIILFYSRILFLGAVGGFLAGVAIHSLFVGWETALHSSFNFNFILVGMALSSIFLIPNWRSYLLALGGVALAVVLADAMEVFFNQYRLPVFTIPFNLVVILMVMLLGNIGYPYFNYYPKETPERSLTYYLSFLFRFGGSGIKIGLPFTGTWQVYQGFDGEWTHKGIWRYAYDFIKTRDGKSYRGDGLRLEDYYSFGADVVAPISGYIYDARSDLPDREIGNPDRQNSWGNYVVIRGTDGTFVEISHLMQNSLKYPIGSYVEEGQVIAKCGNSGYSPEPHIHIQVQSTGAVGAATLPFKFREIIKGKRLYYYQLPKVGEKVTAPIRHPGLGLLLNFILDDLFEYTLFRNGKEEGSYSFWVEMEQNGEFYFTDGRAKLYFYLTPSMFYFYRYEGGEGYLKLLFQLVPRVPLVNGEVEFEDYLPLNVRFPARKVWAVEFLSSFTFKIFDRPVSYRLSPNGLISSKYGRVELNWESKGFKVIEGDGVKLILNRYRIKGRNGE